MAHAYVGDPMIARLNKAISAYPGGVTAYSTAILLRDPSTIHKWRRGQTPIPMVIRQFLERNDK
jgi:hypothetical protein